MLLVVDRAESARRTVYEAQGNGTVLFKGPLLDVPSLVCGHCEAPLAEGFSMEMIGSALLICGRCGSSNETP